MKSDGPSPKDVSRRKFSSCSYTKKGVFGNLQLRFAFFHFTLGFGEHLINTIIHGELISILEYEQINLIIMFYSGINLRLLRFVYALRL